MNDQADSLSRPPRRQVMACGLKALMHRLVCNTTPGRGCMLTAILWAVTFPCSEAAGADVRYHHDINNKKCCLVIAHAGGGIEGNPYTNSEEAMLSNLTQGARIFELDFAKTRDGEWVGTHDWALWKNQTQYKGATPPTYPEFNRHKLIAHGQRAINRPYNPITLPFLEKVVARNKNIVLVTDTKYKLRELAETLRNNPVFDRIYPQAYSAEDVEMLTGLGYRKIILTIYRMDLTHPANLIQRIKPISGKLHALTVPMDFFAENHKALTGLGIPIYTHGAPANINSRELHVRFERLGVSGFYLD